ncbi:MarR family transcriptional regulator [Dactylosporangium aurantiacum]|uniref:MarR family transcriptional regulator n=1 Tax=Dactylosporangium aurantiacum TaxID=35754 RepID=A0A9Q9IMU9_9ACTN|nr:MarR family transcriptional regulator [Dactylosporangium aurantiacum]MDG6103710.1 MarR family transcriptional regulator [Dactylosporangium aurantiacum]UWZ59072.1 MarR family transcriptional regulator [Dactylosporangium aurantiacum]
MSTSPDRAGGIEAAWRRERPDLDPSSIAVITRIWHLAKVFADERRRLLVTLDIDPALLDLLGTLRRSGEPYTLTTRELAEHTLVTAAAISQRLNRAERHGWVMREPGDGRRVLVHLTAAGRELVDRVASRVFDRENELLAALTPEQRRDLAGHLERLVHAVAGPGPMPPVG